MYLKAYPTCLIQFFNYFNNLFCDFSQLLNVIFFILNIRMRCTPILFNDLECPKSVEKRRKDINRSQAFEPQYS